MTDHEIQRKLVNRASQLVAKAAKLRGDAEVPLNFIDEAFDLIEEGEVQVERLSTGAPSMKAVYNIACMLSRRKCN